MHEPDTGPTFEDATFPLAWSIARAYRLRQLTDPLEWFAATRLPRNVQRLASVLDRTLGYEGGLVDLTTWVLEDLPAGKAHMIDTSTDAVWAFVLLWASRLSSHESEPPDNVRFGRNVASRRDVVRRALAELSERSVEVARDLQIHQLDSRILPHVRAAFEEAFAAEDRAEHDRLTNAAIDPESLPRLTEAVRARWAASTPRRILAAAGCVRVRLVRPPNGSRFGLSAVAPKLFFVRDSTAIEDSPARIGEDLGRSLGRGEAAVIAKAFKAMPVIIYRGSLRVRVERAIRSLGGVDGGEFVAFAPLNWKLSDALLAEGAVRSRNEDEEFWTFAGINLYELATWDDPSLVVVRLPGGVRIRQFRTSQGDVEVSITEVSSLSDEDADQQAEDISNDPRVRISVYEHWQLRIVRRHVKRVALPAEIAEDVRRFA